MTHSRLAAREDDAAQQRGRAHTERDLWNGSAKTVLSKFHQVFCGEYLTTEVLFHSATHGM
jgi:hypothetical protein